MKIQVAGVFVSKTHYDNVMNRINEQKSVLNDSTEIWIDVESSFEEERIKPFFQKMFEINSDRKSALEELKKALDRL